MSEKVQTKPHLDCDIHVVNRAKWTLEDLRPYAGQWVAWSFDGTRIEASDQDLEVMVQKLEALGIATDEVVISGEHIVGEFEVERR